MRKSDRYFFYTAANGHRETSQTAAITINPANDRDGDGILNSIEEAGCTDKGG